MNKNILWIAILAITLFSCAEKKEGDMIVQGTIIGLKKGTLYLQKVRDTVLVSVDSISLNGKNTFVLVDNVVEPELYYLTLNEKEIEKIEFFGEKGIITINSKLDKFAVAAEISGSKSNDILYDYKKMTRQFNGKSLDLMKETFDAQKANNDTLFEKFNNAYERLLKNKLRYTTAFSIRNSDSEVAPFLALTELYDAHISLLDTVNNSLTDKVKASKYGVKLDVFIKNIKETEGE